MEDGNRACALNELMESYFKQRQYVRINILPLKSVLLRGRILYADKHTLKVLNEDDFM